LIGGNSNGQIRRLIALAIYCLSILILASCLPSAATPKPTLSPLFSTTPTISPQPHFTQTTKPDFLPTSTLAPVIVSTLKSYPTPISVFDYPNQSTDGVLLFSVEKIAEKCYKVGEPIELKFIFRNLTDATIKIPGDFAIAINRHGVSGNILPFIMSFNGKSIYSHTDLSLIDTFWTPSDEYGTISGNQQIDIVLAYIFPKYVVHPPITQSYEIVTPNPGRYYLRFVYFGQDRNGEIWSGAIGSNQVDLCIIN
jgi:hypothetical protein